MVDLAEQHLLALDDGLQAGVGVGQGVLGCVALAPQPHPVQRLAERAGQEVLEVVVGGLDHIVGRARLERRNRQPAFIRCGDVYDWRRLRQLEQLLQRLQPVLDGHVVVHRHHIEAICSGQAHAFRSVGGHRDLEAAPLKPARDQAAQACVVVDIEQSRPLGGGHGRCHGCGSGTWMTDRKRPSWRMASAKDS